jgi:uncharacterized membrane protein
MLVFGIVIFVIVTMLPGLLAVRLLRRESLHSLDALLYAVGLGLMFNFTVGLVANFTLGINLFSVVAVYVGLLGLLILVSQTFGRTLHFRWQGWKPISIPLCLYLLAVALQLQTTLMSPNLVGSDIHLEYFVSNRVLEEGLWNPSYTDTTLNAYLGLALLLPVYKLMTGATLIWVFKVFCPLMFAVLPVVLYRIFKPQFGTMVSVLAVVFFVTMPMFTMDMVQLIRQQQSELFFILVVLLLLDDNLGFSHKAVLGAVFSVGAITTHVGMAIGFMGYLLVSLVVMVALAKLWRNKVDDAKKTALPILVLACLSLTSVGIYAGYYNLVTERWMATSPIKVSVAIVGRTAEQALAGVTMPPNIQGEVSEEASANETATGEVASPSFFQRFPFLDPLLKEPLTQTAIGLDFAKASLLGKIWRVLQYMVEICLVVGFFVLLFRPLRKIKVEYMSLVIASFVVLAGLFLLCSYGLGLGTTRIWEITLLFMSPLFVLGAGAIGKRVVGLRLKKFNEGRVVMVSTLALLVPYLIFNSGIAFEVAKLEPAGFIDVPYSVALSGQRVDIAAIYDAEDVEAMDWLKSQVSGEMIYGDMHVYNLIIQRMFPYLKMWDLTMGRFKPLKSMSADDVGYIFLRKWNVENNMITGWGSYGSRRSNSLDEFPIAKEKIENGTIVFDNGARVILVAK